MFDPFPTYTYRRYSRRFSFETRFSPCTLHLDALVRSPLSTPLPVPTAAIPPLLPLRSSKSADDVPIGDEEESSHHSAVAPPRFSTASSSSLSSLASTSTGPPASGITAGDGTKSKNRKKKAVCPGTSTSRPLGRHAHASAYIESKADSMNALFIFGGRENADDLTPLGDLW